MTKNDLHAHLEALSKKIANAQKELHDQSAWSDGHKLKSGELEARYNFLKSELDGEVEDLEVHGHHVSALEASVREWFDSLNLGTK
jgi:hypothetical protein